MKRLLFLLLLALPAFGQNFTFCPTNSPTCSYSGVQVFNAGIVLTRVTVATLPASPTAGQIAIVRDGLTSSDCTIGGGTNQAVCSYNGTAWVAFGSGGTTPPGGTTGAIQYNNASSFAGVVLSGLLYGNGASPPTAATANQVNNVLQTLSGCGNSGYVLTPQGSNCVAQSGAGQPAFNTTAASSTATVGTADRTGATDSTAALQTAIAGGSTTFAQKLYIPSGTYLLSSPLHIDREIVIEGAGSGEDTPATTFQLGPKAYVVIDRAGTSPDGGRGDWSVLSNIRFLGTFMTCTATSGNATLASCSQNPSTFLSLSNNDPITVMGSNGAPWQLNVPHGTTVSSMTSNSITMSTTAAFSGSVTVMADGPLVGTGNTSNGSTSITAVTNCSSWQPGDPIESPNIPPLTNSNGTADANFLTGVNCGSNTLTLFSGTGVVAASGGNLYKGPLPNLMAKATARLNNLSIGYSAGHGIDINASASYSPSTIADGWFANVIRFARSGGLNFHVQGADTNAGWAGGLYMAYGAEGCQRDDSFLGNTYIAGECANNGGAGWSTTNGNAAAVLVNPYSESGYTMPTYNSTNTLVLGGVNSTSAVGGNILTTSGQMTPGFWVQNYGEATANVTNGSSTLTSVTSIAHWNVGDTITGQCMPASATVASTDGVSSITISGNATCTQTGVSISHTALRQLLGTKQNVKSVGGFGVSLNTSNYFYSERQLNDYFDTNEWGSVCDTWRNSTKAFCYTTDWAVSKEYPPNAGTGSYGSNGGRIKFPNGFWIGSGVNADYFTNTAGSTAPTSGSWTVGSWSWPQTPTLSGGAAFVQLGTGKSYSTSVTANTTAGSTTISSTSTNFNNSCAPNDWLTGTGIENDTIIFSVNTGASTAVLSRPATATGTAVALTCGRLAKAHPATTGNTSGTTTISSVSPTSSFANGDMITAADIPANTYVVSGGGTGTLVISQAATGSNTGEALSDPTTSWSTVAFKIPNAQITPATSALAANTCDGSASTLAITGVTTSSTFQFTPSADPSGVTGWGANGGLTLAAWPTANTLNYKRCNQTGSSITPSSITFNVSVQ